MGLKKYEIITVGSDKRVRALRSWAVGDRYVNIGDTGGIVYDEKTLSQDGACWLFRGNFGFPGARIGGDSIVDVAEAALSATGAPNVDILGSSVVVGSKLQFASMQTAEDGVVLTAADFEQGDLIYSTGMNWETWENPSGNFVRLKSPVFMGGAPVTVKCAVPGYAVQAYVLDRDGKGITATAVVSTGAGVTLTVPAGQYFIVKLRKDPVAAIVPADATAAKITFTGTYEAKLSIVDSRVEINPANNAGTLALRAGGTYTMSSGAKYPDSVIQNSKVSMMVHATANRIITMMAEFINTSAIMDASVEAAPAYIGVYRGVKNLTFTGSVTGDAGVGSRGVIQVTDCDNFAVSPTVFPGFNAAQSANMPFIFQGCNVPNGIFYHHVQIANTYKNIDFAKAQADLGKQIINPNILVSSEVEGMYRLYSVGSSIFGALVESHDSVKSVTLSNIANSYGTTIYKDAYFNGMFDIAGTNVFGRKVRSHPLAQVLNVQPRAVRGGFTLTAGLPPVPSTEATRVRTEKYFRVNGAKGIGVQNMPAGVEGRLVYLDGSGNYIGLGDWFAGSVIVPTVSLVNSYAYILFRKTGDAAITPADLAGVTVTVYNGCKIVNTGETAVPMRGNIRVEDNATLINSSITGTGYFGGNSVVYYNPAVWASLDVNGTVFMKDNAVFAPTALTDICTLVHMRDNAKFIGSVTTPRTSLSIIMRDNAIVEGLCNTRSGVIMSGNSKVTPTGIIAVASRGILVMEENASIEANTAVIGAITLSGKYKGNVVKTWTGNRTITDVNEPEYDNNVKTQYDYNVKTQYDF
ncbi:hypothetical protein BK745P4_00019 [Bacteroides phage BK745P4]|nr:hypothetical protein BK745P4_00019 [Bacteroides phage BK745P4]